MNINERLALLVSKVLGVQLSQISKNLSPETSETWTSLQHMKLITAVEEEFEIYFSYQEVVDVMKYDSLERIVNDKLEFGG